MPKTPGRVRIAAVGDLHFGRTGYGPPLRSLFAQVIERAEVLALWRDLTDSGEAQRLRGPARAARARPLGRGDHQAVRAGGVERGAPAGDGARPAPYRAPRGASPLFAHRGHCGGRAEGDLSVPGLKPAGGAADAVSGGCRLPRPRPPWRRG